MNRHQNLSERAADVSVSRCLSYGVGSLGIAVIYGSLTQLLLYYYTDIYGLDPRLAGLIAFSGAMIDALIDPAIGWITSQTVTGMGRYRPYLLFGTPLVSVAFVLVFSKPKFAAEHLFAFAFITQIFFRASYQAIYLPYTALLTQISSSASTRSLVASYKAWFTALGQLLVAWTGLLMVRFFDWRYPSHGFLLTSIVIAAMSAICIFQAGYFARERDSASGALRPDVGNPFVAIGHMLRNRYFVLVSIATLTFNVALSTLSGGIIYILRYEINAPDDLRMVLSATFVAGLVATPFWSWLARKHGKRSAWCLGASICAVTLITAAIAHPVTLWSFVVVFAVHGAGVQAMLVVMFASMADTVDYGEWRTGGRTEAMSFGFATFFTKSGLAIAGGISGMILSWVGFHANAVQSPGTLQALRLTLFLLPAALWIGLAILMSFYGLSNERHGNIRRELDRRRLTVGD